MLHTITNKKVWAQKLAEFEQGSPPPGYTNPITYIGAKTDYAFCLWDVPSVDALRPMLDGLTEGAATNLYFPVDPQAFGTTGFPSQRIELDTKAPATR